MRRKLYMVLITMIGIFLLSQACSDEPDNSDLYLLEELETASAVKDPGQRVERLDLYARAHNTHPYRILAYVKLLETIATDLNDLDRALDLFEGYLAKETDPEARGELLYRKFAYLWNSHGEKAIDLAEELIDGGEKDYKLFLYIGYYTMDDAATSGLARRLLEKAIENTEDRFKKNHILTVLAELEDKAGRSDEAYETALRASDYTFANELVGRALWERGERKESLEAYIRLAAGAPGYGEHIRLDSLYALVYQDTDHLKGKILDKRLNDEGPVPDWDFIDIRGRKHRISEYRGTKLVISAWSPT
ncbi:MAG: hypothetical protein JW814_02400 [Candidatus Krumholzibacteriota bacterium]|nr:hypothetical protein [Candidatus Krumholzibacteriota bacterium]